MKIMISACLTGINCKYNGGNNLDEELMRQLEGHELIPVCPELMGGLPVPRIPSEICGGVVMTKNGRNVDREFREGAGKCLETARKEMPELVIFQPRSPSCGVKQRYDGSFSGRLIGEPGITAALLAENGFRVIDAEEFKLRAASGSKEASDRNQGQ